MYTILKIRPALAAAAAISIAAAGASAWPTRSFAQDDTGYVRYRATVLGDSPLSAASSTANTAEHVEVRTVAGSYARYRMWLGDDANTAFTAARDAGEVPMRQTLRVVTGAPLSGARAHERYLGQPTPPAVSYQILAEAPVEAPATLAHRNTAN